MKRKTTLLAVLVVVAVCIAAVSAVGTLGRPHSQHPGQSHVAAAQDRVDQGAEVTLPQPEGRDALRPMPGETACSQ